MTRQPRQGEARTAVVWDLLRGMLGERAAKTGRDRLDVIDAGGGTGGFAVPLARLGHSVTVVDPTLDALAALERRTNEAGVSVRAFQGDAADLRDHLAPECADLVICHSVLEYVDEPEAALTAIRDILRPGGAVSVLVSNVAAAALHKALGGHLDAAARLLTDQGPDADDLRRFSPETVRSLLAGVGLDPGEAHGVRVFADLVPSGLVDGEPQAVESLIALERAAATHPVLSGIATQLHIFGVR